MYVVKNKSRIIEQENKQKNISKIISIFQLLKYT